MTKKPFQFAADMVSSILAGDWTNETPPWSKQSQPFDVTPYERAAQTAEAFIMLFRAYNPRFDQTRFLIACGLANAPAKAKHARS